MNATKKPRKPPAKARKLLKPKQTRALALIPTPEPEQPEIRKDKRGRPTLFKTEYVEMARELSLAGASGYDLANFFDVDRTTINLWRNAHPDFAEAVRIGSTFSDDNIERSLYERAHGYTYTEQQPIKVKGPGGVETVQMVKVERQMPGDFSAMQYWLNNRRSDKWKSRTEKVHSGGVEVTHTTLEQAREKIRAKMAQIRDASETLNPASKTVLDTDNDKEQG